MVAERRVGRDGPSRRVEPHHAGQDRRLDAFGADGPRLRDRPGLRARHAARRNPRLRAAARAGHRAHGHEPRHLQRRVPLGRSGTSRHAVRRARPHWRRGALRGRLAESRVLQRVHDGRDERRHGPAPARHRAREADPHARRARRLAGVQERATPRRRLRGHARRRARRARAARHRRKLHRARRRGAVPLRLGAALAHAGRSTTPRSCPASASRWRPGSSSARSP